MRKWRRRIFVTLGVLALLLAALCMSILRDPVGGAALAARWMTIGAGSLTCR